MKHLVLSVSAAIALAVAGSAWAEGAATRTPVPETPACAPANRIHGWSEIDDRHVYLSMLDKRRRFLVTFIGPCHEAKWATIVQVAPLFHIVGLTIVAILSMSGTLTWWSITVPFMICSFGSGMIVPNSNAGAVGLYPRLAGTASSLVGLAQMGMGAMGTVAVAITTGLGGYDRALPLVGEWIGCTTKACAIPMPLILAQLPFAFAALLAARLLRGPRFPSAGQSA